MSSYVYIGSELELFAEAENWKAHFGSQLADFIKGDVLEVGAGIGGTTRVLCTGRQDHWTCLEPDPQLARQLAENAAQNPFSLTPEVVVGSVAGLDKERMFDAILYIDVLEHIEDDRGELLEAARHLRPGGNLIVLSPAHPFLFSEFDKRIGHYRRYNKRSLRAVGPPDLTLCRLIYLDSVGMLLSLGNRLLLRSGSPTRKQIRVWDRWFVRCSKVVDPLTGWCIGKSIVGVWRRPEPARS